MRLRIATCSLVAAGIVAAGVGAQQLTPPPLPPQPGQSGGFFGHNGTLAFTWPGQKSAEVARLAHEYANTDKEEAKQEIHKKIHDLLNQQFDENAKQQAKELADLEEQITKLRSTLSKRAEHKSEIVDNRLKQLLDEAKGMGWSSPNPYQPFGIGGMGGIPMAPPAAALPKTPKAPKPPDDDK